MEISSLSTPGLYPVQHLPLCPVSSLCCVEMVKSEIGAAVAAVAALAAAAAVAAALAAAAAAALTTIVRAVLHLHAGERPPLVGRCKHRLSDGGPAAGDRAIPRAIRAAARLCGWHGRVDCGRKSRL